jgi:peptide-methionine (S)-S-oxide reductase
VVRTRVGYTGGTTTHPSYHNLGDHSEAIQIDFDPRRISYGELLDVFWRSHNPCARPWSRQYRSAIFYHDARQRRLAESTARRVAKERGADVATVVEELGIFYRAEDYHQKYRLRQDRVLLDEYLAVYPKVEDFVNSTAVTRVNGYLAGHGAMADLQRDLPGLGLSPGAAERLLVMGRRTLSR